MKTCDEMVNNLLKRREQYTAEKKRKRKVAMYVSSACCFLLVISVVGKGMGQSEPLSTPASTLETTSTPEKKDEPSDYTVIWADDNHDMDGVVFLEWNGKQVDSLLLTALQTAAQNSKVAIMAHPRIIDESFCYNGKTLAEYAEEAKEERNLPEKLGMLLKCGESLKYGEALYLTGTPEGEKWVQAFYEETIAFFGEELLSKYIVNGVFFKEQVEADSEVAQNEKTAENAYALACSAYFEHTAEKAGQQIALQGIDYDKKENADYLIIYASENEFMSLTFDGMANWYFSFATEDDDGPRDLEND